MSIKFPSLGMSSSSTKESLVRKKRAQAEWQNDSSPLVPALPVVRVSGRKKVTANARSLGTAKKIAVASG